MINTSLSTRLRELLIDGNCYNPATIFNLLFDISFKTVIRSSVRTQMKYIKKYNREKKG